jgi:Acetyltransferase (GNAT) domain
MLALIRRATHFAGRKATGASWTDARDPNRVFALDLASDSRWAAFVNAQPDGLVYHHPAWSRTIQRTYGYGFLGLASEDDGGTLNGVLPLFEKRGLVTGHRLSSLPHTPVAGPLAVDDDTALALGRAALTLARERRLSLELKLPSPDVGRLLTSPGLVLGDVSYVVDLPERVEDLRFGASRNHGRIKWAVGKAAKQGVRVRDAEDESDLRAWYSLYLKTMRWHGVPPRPSAFFEAMWELLRPGGHMRLLLAESMVRTHRRLIAGSIMLMTARTVVYAFNGCHREYLHQRPNDLIQWHAIHDACRGGFRRYDLGEVTAGQAGLAEFKTKWGAAEHRLYRYRHPASKRVSARKQPALINKAGTEAWRHLPLPVTARVGDWLYRHA